MKSTLGQAGSLGSSGGVELGSAIRSEFHDRVAMLDIREHAQDRLFRLAHAVVPAPLQVADPDHHRGHLVGVDVGFDAVELRGPTLQSM